MRACLQWCECVSLLVDFLSGVSHTDTADLANLTASVRINVASFKGSVIDVIRLVNPGLTPGNAGLTLSRLTKSIQS